MVNPFSATRQQDWWQRLGRSAGVGAAIALVCLASVSGPGVAQADAPASPQESPASPEGVSEDNPVISPIQQLAPPEVRALFENQVTEDAETDTIYLDGRALFEVAAPVEAGIWTATDRANEIEQRLEIIAQEIADFEGIEALDVSFAIDEDSNQPIITVNGEVLMTITYLDAELSGTRSLTLRATQITNILENALTRYYLERQPEFLWTRVQWMAGALLITLLGSFALGHFYRTFARRRRRLKAEQDSSPGISQRSASGQIVDSIRSTLITRQQIKSLRVLEQGLQVGQVALWVAYGMVILGFFPYTRWLQPLIVSTLGLPFRFVLIVLIAYGLIRLADVWIDRLFMAFQTQTAITLERSQRLALRLSTFSQVVKGIVAVLIASIAFFIMLSILGVQVAPLLAGAGLVGVAISFASQSLIKDIINGFLILLEDQYGVGDVITVRGVSGFVETMNLRITQLRDTAGQLITIPNGQIDIVQNLSKEWSRVDLMIPVGLTADINQALHLVEKIANELSQDGVWGSLILEPPLLLGVDNLDHVGATIRIWIKTQPLKQWDVAREYRRRLKIAFEAAHVPIGVPQQIVYVNHPASPTVTAGRTPPPHNGLSNSDNAEERPPTHQSV